MTWRGLPKGKPFRYDDGAIHVAFGLVVELQQGAHQFVLLAGVVQGDEVVAMLVGHLPDVELFAAAEEGKETHGVIARVVIV